MVAAELAAGRPPDAALGPGRRAVAAASRPSVEAHALGLGRRRRRCGAWPPTPGAGRPAGGRRGLAGRPPHRPRPRRRPRPGRRPGSAPPADPAGRRPPSSPRPGPPPGWWPRCRWSRCGMGSGAGGDPWAFLLGTPVGLGLPGLRARLRPRWALVDRGDRRRGGPPVTAVAVVAAAAGRAPGRPAAAPVAEARRPGRGRRRLPARTTGARGLACAAWPASPAVAPALFLGGAGGSGGRAGGGGAAWVALARSESRAVRRARASAARDLPHLVDLLAATLRSGRRARPPRWPPVCAACPGPAADRLDRRAGPAPARASTRREVWRGRWPTTPCWRRSAAPSPAPRRAAPRWPTRRAARRRPRARGPGRGRGPRPRGRREGRRPAGTVPAARLPAHRDRAHGGGPAGHAAARAP